ncbi:response regulator transcription factor [Enterobacter bugandensis]|uniref:Two component LuxR family transcriptional regulator n=1 Tax=Enterobacter bugandensis TaxID=881260 RepID=A0A822WTX1_9ENTR|nr:response regulator transcription factor [Enterobacter bugandensis]MBF2749297.1 response regulator transcription factor [Enterobacter bugandensis]MBF2802056.1 response regulator transcription factor [Enterobacter bugandensis]MCK7398911.1 response regulator transcription factor [Enterobacter bugandensis]MCK7434148.1 response regulator transcription factor [Enterobacter bugandensis]MCM7393782.1 response regulator transcription factor [Enterobacter bugandensis]
MGQNYALVVDDHPLVASGIANFLISHCQFKLASVVTNEEDCYRQIRDNGPPRLLVIDFWLSSGTALKLLKEVKQHYPQVRFLVVSGDDNNDIWQKVHAAGGHGFVLKSEPPEMFSRAVCALLDNLTWFPERNDLPVESNNEKLSKFNLTPRQIDVLNMIMRGLPNKRIAAQLSISEPTVKEHISNILKKIGVNSRVEAITLLHGKRESSE